MQLFLFPSLVKLLIDLADELVKKSTHSEGAHLVAIPDTLSHLLFALGSLSPQCVLLQQQKQLVLVHVLVLFCFYRFVERGASLSCLSRLLHFFFAGNHKILHLLSVEFDIVYIDVCFFIFESLQFATLDIGVDFSDFLLDVDGVVDALLDEGLELAVIGLDRVDVVFDAFAVLAHLCLLFERRSKAECRT